MALEVFGIMLLCNSIYVISGAFLPPAEANLVTITIGSAVIIGDKEFRKRQAKRKARMQRRGEIYTVTAKSL